VLAKPLLALLRSSAPLTLVAIALTIGGCASSAGTKADTQNPFASYPVADIIEAGNKSLESGETERAVYIYMQALEIEQSAETWYRIGIGKGRLGDRGYAWQAFKEAIKLDPTHVGAQEELGLTYMAMAQPEPATFHLKQATELDPQRWRAWNALGVLADMDKQYALAVSYYEAGLLAAPRSPMLMTNIGYSYYLAGDMEQASAWFGRALIVDPEFAPAVKNLALLYARQGWYDQAVKTFSKVTGKPQAYNDVGYVAMRQGDYEQAHELLTEAIRLSPVYYEKAYENLATLKKQMDAAGTATPAEAALRSNSGHIVVAEGQAPRKATVTAEILNVRSSPEADSDVVTHLQAGDPVEVIMTMPNWAFVNYRPAAQDANLTGWVNSRYVGSHEAKSTLMAVPELMATTDLSAPGTTTSPAVAAAPAQTEAAMETTAMEQATNALVPDLAIEEIVVTAPAAAEPLPATFADTTESISGSIDAPLAAQTDTGNTSPLFEAVTQ